MIWTILFLFPQTSILLVRKLCCMCFEDNEAVIEMTIKRRSPTMRRVSRTHRVALDWLFDGINLDTKIQIKYIDTKNQLADILTKGNFTRDEWNHLLCLFNISYFSATNCLEVMSTRTQEDSGEERVTAKSKPMMNLVSRCSGVRGPNVLASTASESPVKTRHESQVPLSSWTAQHQRTGRPVQDAYSSSYSEWNTDEKWSSQEWKSDEVVEARTERPVNNQPVCSHSTRTGLSLMTMIWTPSNTATESDLSLKSRSFLHRVNDQVRNMLDHSSKDATQDRNKHSLICGMHSFKNTNNLTMKQMFDISKKLVSKQSDEICGVKTINWENFSWKYLSLIGDEQVISLQRTKVYVFSDSVLCLGKIHENPQPKKSMGRQIDVVQKFIRIQSFGQH